jgi:DNA-binding PadR family transcriptional regulator
MTEEYGHIPDGFFLSQEEVEELRKSKKELTEYGKQKLRELMSNPQNLYEMIQALEDRIRVLEDENVSTTNELYRLENSLDARIDILVEHCGIVEDV